MMADTTGFPIDHELFCNRCGEHLNPKRAVWLELDTLTGIYHRNGHQRPADLQGDTRRRAGRGPGHARVRGLWA
jgi:hypothetical protein